MEILNKSVFGVIRKLFDSTVRWFTPHKKFNGHPKTRNKPAPVLFFLKFFNIYETLDICVINRFRGRLSYRLSASSIGFVNWLNLSFETEHRLTIRVAKPTPLVEAKLIKKTMEQFHPKTLNEIRPLSLVRVYG